MFLPELPGQVGLELPGVFKLVSKAVKQPGDSSKL